MSTLRSSQLSKLLAGLLRYGTWLASGVTVLGLVLAMLGWHIGAHGSATLSGMNVVTVGIGLFISLPVLRVALMTAVFLHQRDYVFGIIAAVVLAILALGLVLGLHLPGAHGQS